MATAGTVTEAAVQPAGIDHFSGKTVIDATNPIAPAPPENGVLPFFTGPNDSLMERLQSLLPKANLVKAFNSEGNGVMYQPDYGDVQPTMFICGNYESAKATVTEILTSFGWEQQTWAPPLRQGQLNPCASFGASPAYAITIGHMHLNC